MLYVDNGKEDIFTARQKMSIEEIDGLGSKIQGRSGCALMAKTLQVNDPKTHEKARGNKMLESKVKLTTMNLLPRK